MVRNKQFAIRVLIGVNVALLAGLILSVSNPPLAEAQVRGRPGDYMMATVQFHEDRDALVVINCPRNVMGVFLTHPQTGKMGRLALRDLSNDFSSARPGHQ